MAKKPQKFKFRIVPGTDPDNAPAWFWEFPGGASYRDGPFYSIEEASAAVLAWAFECYNEGGFSPVEFVEKDKDLLAAMVEMGEDMRRANVLYTQKGSRLDLLMLMHTMEKAISASIMT